MTASGGPGCGRPDTAVTEQPGLDTRARRTLRWAIGTGLALARYPSRRVPGYRRDRIGDHGADRPDLERPFPGDPETVQRARDGVGPLYHRRYWIELVGTEVGPAELVEQVVADLNAVTPTDMSRFEDVAGGRPGDLALGDELVVRLPGPWEGPIRLIDRTPTSFRFATLDGHMEAGEIVFRARVAEGAVVRFEIESWARSATLQFRVLYDLVPVAREMQLQMWSRFCTAVARRAGGVVVSAVQAHTCTSAGHAR